MSDTLTTQGGRTVANAKELLTQGEEGLRLAQEIIAKALDLGGDAPEDEGRELEDDFSLYDEAAEASEEAAAASTDDEEDDEDDEDDEDNEDNDGGDDDEEVALEIEGVPNQPQAFAKGADTAAEVVDALPILAALDRKLESLEAIVAKAEDLALRLERIEPLVAKAVNLTTASLEAQRAGIDAYATLAKAQNVIASAPLKPKSQRAVVPTREAPKPALDGETLLAKAMNVVADPVRIGAISSYCQLGQPERAIEYLTAEERQKVLGA